MTHPYAISRRTMLRGTGAAVALPLLDVMSPCTDAAETGNETTGPPRRLAYLYFPNGVASGAWDPQMVEAGGTIGSLNRWMKPLVPFQDQLIVIRNMWTPEGNGHGAGTATWLTAGDYNGRRIDAGGVSADQLAARTIGEKTLLPSLELSLRGEGFF
ncbi:MAG: DUF1552 domain-containing protein, partial [Planctomycetota bacterium]|nr:DUF1552 domain-containing protein [Planctomycetota bacterium]